MYFLVTAIAGLVLLMYAVFRKRPIENPKPSDGRIRNGLRAIRKAFETALAWGLVLGAALFGVRLFMAWQPGHETVPMTFIAGLMTLSNIFLITISLFVALLLIWLLRAWRKR